MTLPNRLHVLLWPVFVVAAAIGGVVTAVVILTNFINEKKVRKNPGNATITNHSLPGHQEEEETDKNQTKQA